MGFPFRMPYGCYVIASNARCNGFVRHAIEKFTQTFINLYRNFEQFALYPKAWSICIQISEKYTTNTRLI